MILILEAYYEESRRHRSEEFTKDRYGLPVVNSKFGLSILYMIYLFMSVFY